MGTVTVTRTASSSLNEVQLEAWFRDQLNEMAHEGGDDGYCGNWNANSGLQITNKTFPSIQAAKDYLERNRVKNGPVIAVRIGDFSKAWPATKEQKTMVKRLEELTTEELEFEYRILERAKKQKSKTKKCSHCESSINVHALELPHKKELETTGRSPDVYSFRCFGRVLLAYFIGLTDCPVCRKNLLRTDTDNKNHVSLKKRIEELHKKVHAAKTDFDKAAAGKPQPCWLVSADCAE